MDIREALTKTGHWRGWRNNTGQIGRIRFGLGIGGADLVGILIHQTPDGFPRMYAGRFCSFEIKDAKGKQEHAQVLWGQAVQAAGGFYAVVRTVPEALDALKRALAGETG
jgi:hypothetical protein